MLIASDGQQTDRGSAREILLTLKNDGVQSTKWLAQAMNMTVPGVRQHLHLLENQKLVKHYFQTQGVGRPAQMWQLSAEGHASFPDGHASALVELIESVCIQLGEPALDSVLEHSYQKTLSHYLAQLSELDDVESKLQALIKIRVNEGYMSSLEKLGDGEWLLIENHCPVCTAAKVCVGFCENELKLFRACIGNLVNIERSEYLFEGGRRCTYHVQLK